MLKESVKDQLSAMGCCVDTDNSLRPGKERLELTTFLLERLLKPAILSQVLQKIDTIPQLSEEERQAHKFVALLKHIGFETTTDIVRGCTTAAESSGFLESLTSLVFRKNASEDVTSSSNEPMRIYLPLLEFACTNFSLLTSETSQVLPSDITKATSKNMVYADVILASCTEWSSLYINQISLIRNQVQLLSNQVTLISTSEWKELCSELASKLHQHLEAMVTFSDIYAKELKVWCESLPVAQTNGLGEQAASMLDLYQKVSTVLDSIQTIRSLHKAITTSGRPLVAYQPAVLLRIAERASQEATVLAKQVQVLQKAAALLEPPYSVSTAAGPTPLLNDMEVDS